MRTLPNCPAGGVGSSLLCCTVLLCAAVIDRAELERQREAEPQAETEHRTSENLIQACFFSPVLFFLYPPTRHDTTSVILPLPSPSHRTSPTLPPHTIHTYAHSPRNLAITRNPFGTETKRKHFPFPPRVLSRKSGEWTRESERERERERGREREEERECVRVMSRPSPRPGPTPPLYHDHGSNSGSPPPVPWYSHPRYNFLKRHIGRGSPGNSPPPLGQSPPPPPPLGSRPEPLRV